MSEVAELYRRRADEFEATIFGTLPNRWVDPSPCENWTARDIVAHVVQMHEIELGQRPGGEGPTSPAGPDFDPARAFRASRVDAERVLDDPATAPEVVQRINDVLGTDLPQHRWDLAKATGQDAAMNPDDVHFLWTLLSPQTPKWWAFMRTPGNFGPGIEVYGPEFPISDDAPLQDRLLGLLGRNPAWRRPV